MNAGATLERVRREGLPCLRSETSTSWKGLLRVDSILLRTSQLEVELTMLWLDPAHEEY